MFGTGFDQKETSLSLWKPIDQHLCDCWTREEGGRKFGTLHAYGDGMNRKQKREAPISYRPPIGLRAEFETRLQGSGLSTNAFITAAIFGEAAPRPRRVTMLERQMIGQLLSQAARIHDRLMSAASSSSGATHTAAIEDYRAELVEIRSCLLRALGKAP